MEKEERKTPFVKAPPPPTPTTSADESQPPSPEEQIKMLLEAGIEPMECECEAVRNLYISQTAGPQSAVDAALALQLHFEEQQAHKHQMRQAQVPQQSTSAASSSQTPVGATASSQSDSSPVNIEPSPTGDSDDEQKGGPGLLNAVDRMAVSGLYAHEFERQEA